MIKLVAHTQIPGIIDRHNACNDVDDTQISGFIDRCAVSVKSSLKYLFNLHIIHCSQK